MLQKITLYTIAILNMIGGLFILGTIGLAEKFEPVSIWQWVLVGVIFIVYFIELGLIGYVEGE